MSSNFIAALNLKPETQKKLTIKRAVRSLEAPNVIKKLELEIKKALEPMQLIELVTAITSLSEVRIKASDVSSINLEPAKTVEEIYWFMSVLLPRQDKTILNSNYVVVKNLDRFEIHTLNEKSLIQIRVVLPMVTMLLRNFGIIQKDVIVKMDNSHFSYEKMNVREERLEASLKKSQTSTSPKTGFKLIKSPSSVKDDLKNIYYEGVIFSIDIIKTRSSQLIVKYGVANNNQAMIVNTFTTKELYKPKYKVGDYARFYGDTKYNSYSSEYQISGKSIQMLDKEMFDNIPECISTAKRTEFHVHTNMSQMDATADMSEYLELADKWGLKAITLTDHDSVQHYHAAAAANKKYPKMKINYGLEISVVDDTDIWIVKNPKEQNMVKSTYIFFDLETTNLSVLTSDIIEFGAVKVDETGVEERLQMFIKTEKQLSKFTTELTGITQSMVDQKGVEPEEAYRKIKSFIGDSILVAHNAMFDYTHLNNAFKHHGLGTIENTIIDTMKMSWLLNPEQKFHRLGNLARKENVEYNDKGAHRADYDAKILKDVYLNMIYKAFDKGIRDLSALQDAAKDVIENSFLQQVTVIAKNQKGLKKIYELITTSHTITFNKKKKQPMIPLSKLIADRENILIGSSFRNSPLWEAFSFQHENYKEYFKLFDYIEVHPVSAMSNLITSGQFTKKELQQAIEKMIDVAEELKIPVIATSNAHYAKPEDKIVRDVYISAKGLGGKIHHLFNRKNPTLATPEQHLRSTTDMLKEFDFLNDIEKQHRVVVENGNILNEQIEKVTPVIKGLHSPKLEGSDEKLKEIIATNLKRIYGDNPHKIITDRLNRELDSIFKHGFGIIYYLSSKVVTKSLEDGFLVGSRGSVGSSLAATLSDITEVNPLSPHYICDNCKHHEFTDGHNSGYDLEEKKCPSCETLMRGEGHSIPFETFLGFNADKVPDIDLNFSSEYQARVHEYTRDLLGEKNVFRAGTISTIAARTAFGYVKNFVELTGVEDEYTKTNVTYLASRVEGTKRTTGQHPGGLIVIPEHMDLHDFSPINFPSNDPNASWKTTHIDFHSIHDNVLKLDLLGHVDPSVLRMLQKETGVDPLTIPMNDKEVISLFHSKEALNIKEDFIPNEELGIYGIPEFGTWFVRGMVKETKPKSFSDLVRISGLSHGTDVYTNNAQKIIADGTAPLSEVISVRDDIMVYLLENGFENLMAFQIMEAVRKGKGLTKEWENTMVEKKIPNWYIESCKKIKYMFPKAHATAYVIMAYRIAWYKINYPLEYYAAFFSKRGTEWDTSILWKGTNELQKVIAITSKKKKWEMDDKEAAISSTLDIVLEMYSRGYKISKISLEKSRSKTWIVDTENQALIPPFNIVEGFGDVATATLTQARSVSPFTSISDFKARSGVNKTVYLQLETLGVLSSLPEKKEGTQIRLNI